MNESFDADMLIGLHKLAEQNGDGLIPELLERLQDLEARQRELEGHGAEVIVLPGLHERPNSRRSIISSRFDDNVVIAFPAPRWQKNAERRGKS